MDIVIFGAGLVGTTLAGHLADQSHNVVVVDHTPEVLEHIRETLDVQTVQGSATDGEVMRLAGLNTADLVLAVTNSDESNIVISIIAHAQNNKARIIARVRGQSFMDNKDLWAEESFDRTFVFSPEQAAVDKILDLLEIERAFDVVTFHGGAIQVAGFVIQPTSPLLKRPLRELTELTQSGVLVVAVERAGQVLMPSGKMALEAHDRVYITAHFRDGAKRVQELFGLPARGRLRKVVLGGGGRMTHLIATALAQRGVAVTIIEPDRSKCQQLAMLLPDAVVIHGNPTSQEVLREELKGASTFVSLTDNEEVNFLTAILADQLGVDRAIANMDNGAYLKMAATMGIDAVVSSKLAAVGVILRTLRSGKVMDAAPMLHGQVDAFFIEAQAHSRLVGTPLMQAQLPAGLVVAAIARGDSTQLPRGDTVIQPGDKVLLITPHGLLRKMDELLALQPA